MDFEGLISLGWLCLMFVYFDRAVEMLVCLPSDTDSHLLGFGATGVASSLRWYFDTVFVGGGIAMNKGTSA